MHHSELRGKPNDYLRKLAPEATHQHFKGGLYKYLGPLYDSETGEIRVNSRGEKLCGYLHIYPHARKLWDRPIREFFGKKDDVMRYRDIRD